ncbi:MAG: hypothetical protein ABI766_07545 [Gemmatimonadales bacterium]
MSLDGHRPVRGCDNFHLINGSPGHGSLRVSGEDTYDGDTELVEEMGGGPALNERT